MLSWWRIYCVELVEDLLCRAGRGSTVGLTVGVGAVLAAAGAGGHQRYWVGLVLGGLVGLGGHHELLADQTRGGGGAPVINGLKLESWGRERQEMQDDPRGVSG